jgi:site-specific DNA-methyltransferase (adenine-specific)
MSDTPPAGRIVQGDVLEVLPEWPDGCVDLVFADPPFNIKYAYDQYHDHLEYDEYNAWTGKWVTECLRVLKPTGTIWIAIGDDHAAEVRVMMRPRATLRSWVIWHYTFGQNCKAKFNRSHTHLFYFVKDPKAFTFNVDDIRVPSERQLTYNDKRANPKGRLPYDVWTFSRVCGTFRERVQWHPCQMPVVLLERIIRGCSKPGDLVLDPFAGSGTTLVAASRLGRRWVGVELSRQYAERAMERIRVEGVAEYPISVDGSPPKKYAPRGAGPAGPPKRRGRPRKLPPPGPSLFTAEGEG